VVGKAVVAPMAQAVVLLVDCPQMKRDLDARRAARAGGSRGLRRGRMSCRRGGIFPPSAILRGE